MAVELILFDKLCAEQKQKNAHLLSSSAKFKSDISQKV